MLRKTIQTLLIITASLFVLSVNAYAAERLQPEQYSDLPTGWSRNAMVEAINNGYLYGYDGKILPKSNLTRAQLAAVTNRAFGKHEMADISHYTDVSANAWYKDDIAYAVYKKTLVGSGYQIFPDRDATREEAFVVLARAMNFPSSNDATVLQQFADYEQISSWAIDDLAVMVSNGCMYGANGKLQPKTKISREEFAYVISQLTNFQSEHTLEQQVSKLDEQNVKSDTGKQIEEIVLNSSQNIIKDQNIIGNVIINEGIVGGELLLDGTTIDGNIIYNSGSFEKLALTNGTKIKGLVIYNENAALKIDNLSGEIGIITISGNHCDISLFGSFNKVDVNAFSSIVNLMDNSSIEKMNAADGAYYSQFNFMRDTKTEEFSLDAPGLTAIVNDNSFLSNLSILKNADGAAIKLNNARCGFINTSAVGVNMLIQNSNIQRLLVNEAAIDTIIESDDISKIIEYEDRGSGTTR